MASEKLGMLHINALLPTGFAAISISAPTVAVIPFPEDFHSAETAAIGTTLHVRVGGTALRSCCCTGSATRAICGRRHSRAGKDHTVIVPDLRGMGLSAHPDTGYTKKNEAADIAGVMDALNIKTADLVTHDIGNMVGYALAPGCPGRITKWVVIDAPLPWRQQLGGAAQQSENMAF